VGATPVLADIGEDGNIDPDSIARRITSRTRAILPVHLAGLPCEMDAIWALARKHNLSVIEDAAHAVGSLYKGVPIGNGNPAAGPCSDAVAFSFYANKNLTTGEGGMVTTPYDQVDERIRVLRLHGISRDAWNRYAVNGNWYYEVVECGFKYNLSDILSAVGIHQLRKQEKFVAIRSYYADLYSQAFADLAELQVPPDSPHCRHSWHLYMIRLNLESLDIDRDEFIAELRRRNVCASVHFIPIPLHPFYASMAQYPQNQCPRALGLYPRLISLPLYPKMTEEQVHDVVAAVKDVARSSRKRVLIA
jgi:dTDP-4-amino-4,6-dideoxygalactose transaminase